jgi:hypothetical protein
LPLVGSLIATNQQQRQLASLEIGGVPLADFAAVAREELHRDAVAYTSAYRHVTSSLATPKSSFLLSGHQPELFHSGVWYKNYLLSNLAQQHDALAVNLIIDNDTCTSTHIRVPTGTPEAPRLESVAFDLSVTPIVPYEQRQLSDRATFHTFATRVRETIGQLVPNPLVDELWQHAVSAENRSIHLGQLLAEARHRLEGDIGLETLEVPWSVVCDSRSFQRFFAHFMHHLPALHACYNQAVLDYRAEHGLRSQSHPVPLLRRNGSWWETPFWIWSDATPQRQPLWIEQSGSMWRLRGDSTIEATGADTPLTIEVGSAESGLPYETIVDQLRDLRHQGIKIRSRALITTFYARTVLSDLFLHGIGGATYDQVTNVLIERMWQLPAPRFVAASATMLLPIPRPAVDLDDLRQVSGLLRDLWYHPERHLEWSDETLLSSMEVDRLTAEKRGWLDGNVCGIEPRPHDMSFAKQRHEAISRINAALRTSLQHTREQLIEERESLQQLLRVRQALGSREFSFCLFPYDMLVPALRKL